ncbi:MAG: TolC family protein, partial [Ginsengibacter sp.]
FRLPVLSVFIFAYHPTDVISQPRELTLEECYALAKSNYPLIRQQSLIQEASAFSIESISKSLLPQINVNAQSTYQSDVTSIPVKFPGIEIPVPAKNQYKIVAEVNQILYDGGLVNQQKKLAAANAGIEQSNLEVDLYQLKERINGLFFGLLLNAETFKQHELVKADIQNGIARVQALIRNGTALKSSLASLQAEALLSEQQSITLKSARRSYLDMLGLLIQQNLPDSEVLKIPPAILPSKEITRPELQFFQSRKSKLAVSSQILKSQTLPKASLFLQAGAGKPGLNMLSNQFDPYYIGGIKLMWGFGNLYTYKSDKSNLEIEVKKNDIQKETFLFNTRYALVRQESESQKFLKLSDTDDEIIALRKQVKNSTLAQLQNGTVNSSDYLRDVYAEENAAIQKIMHELQYLSALYSEKTLRGN